MMLGLGSSRVYRRAELLLE